MQIKHQIGKLTLGLPLSEIATNQQATNGVVILPILPSHIFALDNLPAAHKDPFDRLLIAQAVVEETILLSKDPIFTSYPVRVLW